MTAGGARVAGGRTAAGEGVRMMSVGTASYFNGSVRLMDASVTPPWCSDVPTVAEPIGARVASD